MNRPLIDRIVSALLYEGYILYPYRPSVKNVKRWTFGGLVPRAWSERHATGDTWSMQCECLVAGGPHTVLDVRVRFLQLVERTIGRSRQRIPRFQPGPRTEPPPDYDSLDSMTVAGRTYHPWQEALERETVVEHVEVSQLLAEPLTIPFVFTAGREWEPVCDIGGDAAGLLIRERQEVTGSIELSAQALAHDLVRLRVRVSNETPLDESDAAALSRDEVLLRGLASTHIILGASGGRFLSLLDPPEQYRSAAEDCRNVGCWPVLVGEAGDADTLLASPIILYDYPQIAPESPGDLFDGTEIDEILSLRIMTLSDDEKAAAAAVDARARALLERTDALLPEQLAGLHGAMRKAPFSRATPFSRDSQRSAPPRVAANGDRDEPPLQQITIAGGTVRPGDRVRLRPKRRADAFDLFLDGRTAIIESIEEDREGEQYLAVAIDDDPGRDFGLERMPGHRFFYRPDEVEPLESEGQR